MMFAYKKRRWGKKMSDVIVHAIVLGDYLLVMLGIGAYFFNKSKKPERLFSGRKNLNVWVPS
jgi:Na+/proline symporter